MTVRVSYDVEVARGTRRPERTHQLPPMGQTHTWEAPLLDRIGETVRRNPAPVFGGAALGSIAGVLLTRKVLHTGFLKQVGAGVAGALPGGLAAGWSMRGTRPNPHDLPAGEATLPKPLTQAARHEKVKVMTYNVHGGMGEEGMYGASKRELDRLAAVVRRENPDILILQELDRHAARSNYRNTLDGLANRLRPDTAVGGSPGTLVTGRTQSVGIMTFHGFKVDNARNLISPDEFGSDPVRRIRGFFLDARKAFHQAVLKRPIDDDSVNVLPSYFPRSTIDGVVRTPQGSHVRVLGGHYSGPTRQADYQSSQIAPLALRLQDWQGPTIIGADFNVWSGGAAGRFERQLLGLSGLKDAFLGVGVQPGDERRRSSRPGTRADIDRVYASPHFHVNNVRVVQEDKLASDHRPVVAELTLKPASPAARQPAPVAPPPVGPAPGERPTGQPLLPPLPTPARPGAPVSSPDPAGSIGEAVIARPGDPLGR